MIYRRKPKDFSPSFETASCFIEQNGKILLLKRNSEKSYGGKWGVPAGKMDKNENKTQAAIREVEEETGILIPENKIKFFKTIYVNHKLDFTYHMFHFSSKTPLKIKINPKEHNDFKWIAPEKHLSLDLVDNLDECIKMFYFKE